MIYLLYNEKSNANRGRDDALKAKTFLEEKIGKIELRNVSTINPEMFLKDKTVDDMIILQGGDGTLNHLVNIIDCNNLKIKFYLFPNGTGNDFLNDVKNYQDKDTQLICLNDYIKDLPVIEVKGQKHYFLNGIGYGIDGECCVEAENKKSRGETDIDYSKITIDLLLHSYVPRNAKVIVDGKEYYFKKVYLASAMYGKYYGGGMMIAPTQKRNNHLLSFVTIYGKGKLGTLLMFPKIFKGKHLKYKKNVALIEGKEITVEFDKPCGLQIDGEVVEDVLSYKVSIK